MILTWLRRSSSGVPSAAGTRPGPNEGHLAAVMSDTVFTHRRCQLVDIGRFLDSCRDQTSGGRGAGNIRRHRRTAFKLPLQHWQRFIVGAP